MTLAYGVCVCVCVYVYVCVCQVFGADVTDTMMCQGLLIIMHQSRLVRMYDFNQLLREHKVRFLQIIF